MPRMKASCLRDFGLADAGRAGEQEGADRLVAACPGRERAILIGRRQRVDRLVLAEHHALQVAVERLAACRGRRWTRSPAGCARSWRRSPRSRSCRWSSSACDFGRMRCAAPASSITSIALSGRWRSLMKLAPTARPRPCSAAGGVLDAVVLLEARLQALAGSRSSARPIGSTTSTFWKRRDSARPSRRCRGIR